MDLSKISIHPTCCNPLLLLSAFLKFGLRANTKRIHKIQMGKKKKEKQVIVIWQK
jgi:hypothetical protein